VGRWLLLEMLGAKAAASLKLNVTTATTSNDRIIFRMERFLLLAVVVRGLSMVVDDQFCEIKWNNSDEEHRREYVFVRLSSV
jgi:hypothetical protein